MKDATITLDTVRLHELIAQIRAYDAPLADTLETLVGMYRFDEILQALEATNGHA